MEKKENLIERVKAYLGNPPTEKGWEFGVYEYAQEILENLQEWLPDNVPMYFVTEKYLLNGADDWPQYSWGGCSLIYDGDIAERLCTQEEFTETEEGEYHPEEGEWLDLQAKALKQAANMILAAVNISGIISKGIISKVVFHGSTKNGSPRYKITFVTENGETLKGFTAPTLAHKMGGSYEGKSGRAVYTKTTCGNPKFINFLVD